MSTGANARGESDPRAKGVLWERASFAFVLFVWLECLVATQAFIAACASRTPVTDDISLFYVKVQRIPFWEYLWALHNEHRLPLPKILQYWLYDWTGDIRSGMFAQAQIYAAIALACILVVRRLRGGSRPWDAFFPLMWLQLGNSGSLLMGFQLAAAVPGACVCTLLFCGVFSEQRLRPSRALASGLALLALPLCGGGGLLQAPALAAFCAWLGFTNRRHAEPRERRGARIYLGFALATVVLVGLYFVNYERPPTAHYSPRENPPWRLAVAVLTAPFGPGYFSWRPLATPAIALGAALLALIFLRRGLRAREPSALGTLAALAAGAMLVSAIGLGRPVAGSQLVAERYVPMPAPFYVALTLGGLVLLDRRWRESALVIAFTLMCLALPRSIRYGIWDGAQRIQHDRELGTLVATHASWTRVHACYSENFMLGMSEIAEWLLRHFSRHGLPPFSRAVEYGLQPREYPTFVSIPIEVRCLEAPVTRFLDDERVSCVAPPTTYDFRVSATDQRITGLVGVPELLLRRGQHPGVRGHVMLRGDGEEPRVLGEIRLDPQNIPGDRGLQGFEFHWPAGTTGVLQLVFERIPRDDGLLVSDRIAVCNVHVH